VYGESFVGLRWYTGASPVSSTMEKRLKIGNNLESFLTKSAYDGINPQKSRIRGAFWVIKNLSIAIDFCH